MLRSRLLLSSVAQSWVSCTPLASTVVVSPSPAYLSTAARSTVTTAHAEVGRRHGGPAVRSQTISRPSHVPLVEQHVAHHDAPMSTAAVAAEASRETLEALLRAADRFVSRRTSRLMKIVLESLANLSPGTSLTPQELLLAGIVIWRLQTASSELGPPPELQAMEATYARRPGSLEVKDGAIFLPPYAEPVTDLELMGVLRRQLAYSLAAYHAEAATIATDLQVRQHDLLAYTLDASAESVVPAYFVAVDRVAKQLVIAVRGTSSLTEVLVNFSVSPDSFLGGRVHRGMHLAAEQLQCELTRRLDLAAFFRAHPDYSLVCTGHSMGAAVAGMLAMSLKVSFPHTRAYLFCTPSCVSKDLAASCAPYVVSVINGDDCVPRFHYDATIALKLAMRNLDVQRTVLRSLGLDKFLTPGTVAALLAGALRVGDGLTTVGRWLRLGIAMLWAPLGHWAESLEQVYGTLPGLPAFMRLQQSLAGIQAPLQKAQPAVEKAVKAAVDATAPAVEKAVKAAVEATAPLATQVATSLKTASAASVQTASQVASTVATATAAGVQSAASGVQSATAGVKSAVSKALPVVTKALPLRRSTITDEEFAARQEKAWNAAAADIAAARLAKKAEDALWESAVAEAGRKKDGTAGKESTAPASSPATQAVAAAAATSVAEVERPPPAPAGSYVPRLGPGAPKSVMDDDSDMQLRIVFTAQLWPRDAETPEEEGRIGKEPSSGSAATGAGANGSSNSSGSGSGGNDEMEVIDALVGSPIDPYDGHAGEDDGSAGSRAMAEAARQFTIEESGPTLAVVAKRVRAGSGFGGDDSVSSSSQQADASSAKGDPLAASDSAAADAACAAAPFTATAAAPLPSASTDPLQYYVPGTLLFMGYPQGYTRQVLKLQRAREREKDREKAGRSGKAKEQGSGANGSTSSASGGLGSYGSAGAAVDGDDEAEGVSPALTTLFEPMADDASLLMRARNKRSRGLQQLASRLAAASSYGHYLQEAKAARHNTEGSDDDDDDEAEDEGYFRRRILRPVTSAADSWWRIARDDLGYTHGLQQENDSTGSSSGSIRRNHNHSGASTSDLTEDPASPPAGMGPSAEPGKQLYHPPVLDDYRGPVLMRLRHPWEGLVNPPQGALLYPPHSSAHGSLPLAGAPMLDRFVAASARDGDDADSDSDDEEEGGSSSVTQRVVTTALDNAGAAAVTTAAAAGVAALGQSGSGADLGRQGHPHAHQHQNQHQHPHPHHQQDHHQQGSHHVHSRRHHDHQHPHQHQHKHPHQHQHDDGEPQQEKPRSSVEAIGMAAASAAAQPAVTQLPPPPPLPATVLPRDDSRYFSTFVLSSSMLTDHLLTSLSLELDLYARKLVAEEAHRALKRGQIPRALSLPRLLRSGALRRFIARRPRGVGYGGGLVPASPHERELQERSNAPSPSDRPSLLRVLDAGTSMGDNRE